MSPDQVSQITAELEFTVNSHNQWTTHAATAERTAFKKAETKINWADADPNYVLALDAVQKDLSITTTPSGAGLSQRRIARDQPRQQERRCVSGQPGHQRHQRLGAPETESGQGGLRSGGDDHQLGLGPHRIPRRSCAALKGRSHLERSALAPTSRSPALK